MKGIQSMQESFYTASAEYRGPHLRQPLYGQLVKILRQALKELNASGLPLTVLEIGAGHGGYTEPALAAGCRVTAVEMSRPSLARLDEKFGTNPNFTGVFDEDGSLAAAGGHFSLVLYASVLHHIPDYLEALEQASARLTTGGMLLSFQDPIWYPRQKKAGRALSLAGYYMIRLGRGNLKRGAATLSRRIRGQLDESNSSDMVEYHVVRKGVDESAIQAHLLRTFESVRIVEYWSNQSSLVQQLGTQLRFRNTFGVLATGYRG